MREFISWIEKEGRVLFLTAKDIDCKHGKETLEGCLDNDFIGHNAIRRFYAPPDETELSGGINWENMNFWNGLLPKEIKDAWNNGELDGMLRYLQSDDLAYIIAYAPIDFAAWAVKHRHEDSKAMKMKKDEDYLAWLVGIMAEEDYRVKMKGRFYVARLTHMALTGGYATMKKDSGWIVGLVERLVGRPVGMTAQDYEAMKKDKDSLARLGMIITQYYEAMEKDDDRAVRLARLSATIPIKDLVRPRL